MSISKILRHVDSVSKTLRVAPDAPPAKVADGGQQDSSGGTHSRAYRRDCDYFGKPRAGIFGKGAALADLMAPNGT